MIGITDEPPGETNKPLNVVANPDSNPGAGVKLGSFKFVFLCRRLSAIKEFGWVWFRCLATSLFTGDYDRCIS